MCLCWNDDGSICNSEELADRIKRHLAGEYKPELKKLREQMTEERSLKVRQGRSREEFIKYMDEKCKNYPWPWK